MKRKLLSSLCCGILLFALLPVGDGLGSSALAATRTRGDACGPGACGSVTFDFEGKRVISNASLSVKDTSCDTHDVYIKLRVTDARGVADVMRLDNAGGCRAGHNAEDGQRHESRTIINGAQVIVCVDDFGSDTCYFSRFIDNPES
jgi:hypothetical protein